MVQSDSRGAEGGRCGDWVRSDLWARFEPRDRGGLRFEVVSRAEAGDGEAIRRQVAEVLGDLGVEHGLLQLEDRGAPPFAIQARIEAAVVASGFHITGDARPAPRDEAPVASRRDRLRRSRLYLPGNEPKYMQKAGLHRPDGIILDLEDSVHPGSKLDARLLVRNALRTVDFHGAERMVRINPLPLGLDDLESIVPERPELILIPKVERAEQVREVVRAIDARIGPVDEARPIWLMPILESALGLEHAFEIASSSPRIVALTLGLEDLAAELGMVRTLEGAESDWARGRTVNAAVAAGLQPIDSVYSQVDDLDGLAAWCRRSRQIGFRGMGCLHPRQIPVIHEAYAPGPAELERALQIVEAFERAEREGLAVVSLGSKMIDLPVVRQARRTVEQARAAGRLPEGGTDD